jgi:hypothetical protein
LERLANKQQPNLLFVDLHTPPLAPGLRLIEAMEDGSDGMEVAGV